VAPLFRFVQLELPWELGPPDGRYVIRGHAGTPRHVLVLATLAAGERRGGLRLGRGRGPRRAPAGPRPAAVAVTRATLVDVEPFSSRAAADAWRAGLDGEADAAAAVRVLNRVLHAQRTASADPYVREVARKHALVIRVGVGEGEQVAHGAWTDAVELPAPPRDPGGRMAALGPQERLAALLGGRDVALACEELTLRARTDLDGGRGREAALQLRVALEAALAELVPWSDRPEVADRLAGLRGERRAVGDAANSALEGGLDDATQADVERVVAALEAALRARSAAGP